MDHATVWLHGMLLLTVVHGHSNVQPDCRLHGAMSIESTVAQVSAIRHALADPALLIGSSVAPTGGTEAPPAEAPPATTATTSDEPSFAETLRLASSSLPTPVSLGTPGESAGMRIVAIAESQLGQTEQPPGSNESPAIAQYRTATAGAIPGAPWCAYFASWVARQAGEPLGAQGQGIGDVSDIWSWAQSTGRAIPNGPGVVPKPGDLIVFGGEHVGIVRGILPNGQIATIEGNYENKVAANVRSPTEATGYVSMS
jgi:hypothetical protein